MQTLNQLRGSGARGDVLTQVVQVCFPSTPEVVSAQTIRDETMRQSASLPNKNEYQHKDKRWLHSHHGVFVIGSCVVVVVVAADALKGVDVLLLSHVVKHDGYPLAPAQA